ncbi:helix-turn-helix domain-containing protein [Flavobacterium sp. MFBS3-15]|uniref:GlxA family transcriptional regulator n=1 Tax=Flavobacterium sp. MFBS3-15 TaxID=2989816 RepID=UPI0022364A50|nr:helix-turn-helix domain-containing protein [Flavobacterium sp. MFBS3-15]MCW4469451.1 helix-turn-helix domain-containing protein [Flavobacterium sp. MFBS3-15]
MQIGILLTKGHRLLSVAALLDVLETANRFYVEEGETAPFTIDLLHLPEHECITYPGHNAVQADADNYYDLLLIPSFTHDGVGEAMQANRGWIPWLQNQYREGAALASFCTGAFVLAATGLLDGKPATTHINAEASFARLFPNVLLQAEAVVTEKDRIYTSGGATNTFHLLMLLLEVYCSRKVAVKAAKVFSIDLDRNRQTYFGTFMPSQDHGDDLVKQAQEEIKKKFSTANTIEELIIDVPASRRNLVRRFKQVTGITPIEYLQKTRIEAAKQMLEQSRYSILEVMLESGYNDLKTFRTLFKKTVGMTPKMYREKFSGQMV